MVDEGSKVIRHIGKPPFLINELPDCLITLPMTQPNNPLHGITLEMILNHLVEQYGWEALGRRITIRCFTHEPSVKSSLAFLRKTPWARKKVEELYLETIKK